ncbi:MAG: hypothetical protein ACLRT5_18135 [Lachnospiraceae bacterium]
MAEIIYPLLESAKLATLVCLHGLYDKLAWPYRPGWQGFWRPMQFFFC